MSHYKARHMGFEYAPDYVGSAYSMGLRKPIKIFNQLIRCFEADSPFAHTGVIKMSIS